MFISRVMFPNVWYNTKVSLVIMPIKTTNAPSSQGTATLIHDPLGIITGIYTPLTRKQQQAEGQGPSLKMEARI